MTYEYRYNIYDSHMSYTPMANYNEDHIVCRGETYYSHTSFMRDHMSYKKNFVIKCIGSDNKIIFTTSYKKLECNLTRASGKDRIKELYSTLEKIKNGEYVKESEDPLIDRIDEKCNDKLDKEDSENSDEELEPEDILKFIKSTIKMTMKMTSKYKKHLESSSEIQKYTQIYEQLNMMMENIKN